MDISKQTYQGLTPKQRALACHSAVNRCDQGEIDRLIGQVPKDRKHGQAILGLGQAMDCYNIMMSKTVKDYLLTSNRLNSARAFCNGWIAAGGSPTDEVFLEKQAPIEALEMLIWELISDVEAIRQAAREWCVQNSISTDLFSGPFCFLQLTKSSEGEVNQETLIIMRSLFAEVKLAW